jgi:K(+)-stimulated pyrophosphate-energized sodium pump
VSAQPERFTRSGIAPTSTYVTQLALLLALALIGLVSSFVLGRLEVERGPVSSTVKRLEGALERASLAVLWLGARRGLALLAVPAVGLTAFIFFARASGPVSPLGQAVFCTLSLALGAASALLQARVTLALGARAASSSAAAAARGSARAVRPLLRATGAAAIFGESLGLVCVAGAFASLYSVLGGFAAPGGNAALARSVVQLLPAFALGAAVVALALAREGSVSASAARVGSGQASGRHATFEPGDARDPALLAELVGHQVGELLPRALTSYVCGVSATVAAALLATSGAQTGAPLSALLLVLLVRAFGAVGSVCGVMAARATEEESPVLALVRAQASALTVSLFGLGSALFWLEREHFFPLLAAGALGLLVALVVAQLAWLPLRRGSHMLRELMDARAAGDAAAIVRAAGSGLSRLWPALLLPALALALGQRLASAEVPSALLQLTFLAGVLALAPLALAVAGFGLLLDHTRGVAALARLDSERSQRSRLDEASALSRAVGSTHTSLVLSASLGMGLLSCLGAGSQDLAPSLAAVALATGAGVSLVLLFAARSAGSAVQGARLVSGEIERQLRDLPRHKGVAQLPADFTPSYRACVEVALTAARDTSITELALLLVAPFLLGALAFWSAEPAFPNPLVGFALAALLSGVVYTLAARATRALLSEASRRARTDSAPSSHSFSTYGELVGVTAAASVEALVCALALTVLCLATLLS